MIKNSILQTKKCKCDNPLWHIVYIRKILQGKDFGKLVYTYCCLNCSSQWQSRKEEKVLNKNQP